MYRENITFFDALLSMLKCAFCRIKNCPVRYMPGRKKLYYYDGVRYAIRCKKDRRKY